MEKFDNKKKHYKKRFFIEWYLYIINKKLWFWIHKILRPYKLMEGSPQHSIQKYGFLSTVFISLNCCLGATVYGAPWAFNQAGWLFSIFITLLILCILTTAGAFILQILSRMEIIHKYQLKGYIISPVPITDLFKDQSSSNYKKISKEEESDNASLIKDDDIDYPEIKYDVTFIGRVLLGKNGEKIIAILVILTNLVQLCGCSSVFASSLVNLLPIGSLSTCNIYVDSSFSDSCRYKYMFYIFVLALISWFMIFYTHVTEQLPLLIAIASARLLAISIMIITCLIALSWNQEINNNETLHVDTDYFKDTGFSVAFFMLFMSLSFHIFIPDVIHSYEDKHIDSLEAIVTAILISTVIIITLGTVVSFTINDVEQVATINWSDFSNGSDHSDREWWTVAVEYFVGAIPALGVISMFSIIAINTADNVESLITDHHKSHKDHNSLWKYRAFVLAVSLSVPLFLYDMWILFAVSGFFSLILQIIYESQGCPNFFIERFF